MRRKKNIACAAKNTKMIISSMGPMENFSRTLALKMR